MPVNELRELLAQLAARDVAAVGAYAAGLLECCDKSVTDSTSAATPTGE